MSYRVVIFAWRKPGTTPAEFKQHYEDSHVPLIKSIVGDLFPISHSRYYIERASTADDKGAHAATVLVGGQDDFSYDAYSELLFKDQEHFQKFFGMVSAPEAAKKLGDDEEKFLDRPKLRAAVVGDLTVTKA